VRKSVDERSEIARMVRRHGAAPLFLVGWLRGSMSFSTPLETLLFLHRDSLFRSDLLLLRAGFFSTLSIETELFAKKTTRK
ncbi:hypothetical protein L6R29_03535, partial [Myxococcota bacterium]|nr:hypothetical protein [Myxococcota bacterium]